MGKYAGGIYGWFSSSQRVMRVMGQKEKGANDNAIGIMN